MIVAIAGASGLTGNLCLQELLLHTQVSQVISIGRRYTGLQHQKLQETLLVNNQLMQPVRADAFICCIGTTLKKAGSQKEFRAVDYELPVYLAKELKRRGCNRCAVISAMGATVPLSFSTTESKEKWKKA